MKRLIIHGILILCLFLTLATAEAQRPVIYDSPLREYNTALELFQKNEYGSAQEYFHYVYENTTDQQYDMKSTSYFYEGVCAVKLNHGNAAFLLCDFVRKYPIHTYVPEAHLYIARSYYYQKQYKKALDNFNEIDERKVPTEDLAEYYFKKGFCNLYAKDKDEAKYFLRKAREYDGQYKEKAIYYLAHIEYEDGQYESALADFEEIKDVKEYSKVVPSYILQIRFLQGEYETVANSAPKMLEQSTDKAELYRIAGISHFNLGQYSQAAPYFNKLLGQGNTAKNNSELDRPDHYAIGFTYYKVNEYAEAIRHLSQVTDTTDAMTQNAYYVIADCFLKQNKLADASNYFFEASKLDYSADIQEDAFYNYAKLQYETSNAAFQQKALSTIEEYISRYPHTSRASEMETYLAAIYASTKNYAQAVKAIEKLDRNHKSPEILRSYQRCTHFRAMELISDKKYKDAGKMLDKSLQTPLNQELHLSNLYWKAEAQYRDENYKDAYASFIQYHKCDKVTEDENYPLSLYSFGYAALKTGKYKEAQNSFNKFLSFCNTNDYESYKPDVYARIGDCYFMQKELRSAITNYERCEQLKGNNADYALYQQSLCYSYQQNTDKEVELLEKFTKYHTKSPYIEDVEFELANIYHAQNQYTLAINSYNNFVRKYSAKSPNVRKAYNKMAQAYLNAGQQDKAIETFKLVVDKYPGSMEAKEAVSNLQDIYSEMGRPGDFLDYVTSKGNISISPERQDSITYSSAKAKYTKGDCEMAIAGFSDYIKKFPNGFFISDAYFYRAECEYGNRNYDEALVDYEYLVTNFRTDNNEIGYKKAATILFNKKDYTKALTRFNDLLSASTSEANTSYAYNGIMRCAYELHNYKEALDGAKGYIASPKADPELMDDANLIAGKSSLELRDYSATKKYLKPLAQNGVNAIAAEAAFYCALAEYRKGDLPACEKEITEIIEAKYSSAYWIAKTFILYGDYYAAIGNDFQARHTYQSIVDNYDGDDLREEARQRIAALNPQPSPNAPIQRLDDDDDSLNPED